MNKQANLRPSERQNPENTPGSTTPPPHHFTVLESDCRACLHSKTLRVQLNGVHYDSPQGEWRQKASDYAPDFCSFRFGASAGPGTVSGLAARMEQVRQ